MRLVQFALPADRRDAILEVLDEQGVDYVLLSTEDGQLVQFPLPTQAVEPVLSEVRDVGLEEHYVVVTNAESATTDHFDDLDTRYVAGSEADESIQPDELAAKARDLTPNATTYYSMTLLSAVVALAGLLLDSPALVVGSMVIAPQVGSALTTAVGVVAADRDMVRSGLFAQVGGLLAAIVGATVAGWLLRTTSFVPAALDVTTVNQIGHRTSPGALSLVVGLAAGAAGSLGLATAFPVSLVGVMVAAALIPAAAAVGIGLAWELPVVAAAAALLLVLNLAAVNLVAPGVLWLIGYRPADWGNVSVRRYARVAAVVVVLLAVFAGAASFTADQMAFERQANDVVVETLADDEYENLTLVSVRATAPLIRGDPAITVVVERPADEPYPGLGERIASELAARTGQQVTVEVQFVERNQARP